MMGTAPGDKVEIGRKIRQLRKAEEAVHDLASFRQFIALYNDLERNNHQVEMAGLNEPDVNAKSLGSLYLVLYLIGSGVALLGQALD